MFRRNFKGIHVIVFGFIACLCALYNINSDFYSTQFTEGDLKHAYIEDYTGDSTNMLRYVDKTDSTIKSLSRGPISIKCIGDSTIYDVELQYAAQDNSTVFKVYATDYISEDNSGGKIFVNERLDPSNSAVKTSFVLDQNIDSLYISLETDDENFHIGRINLRSTERVFSDTKYIILLIVAFSLGVIIFINRKNSNLTFEFNNNLIKEQNAAIFMVLVAVIAVFVSSLPLMDANLIGGHDIRYHMSRIEGLARGLQSGQFPVRIHGGILNDYGYPNSLFYPEMLLYIPAILSLLGISVYSCYKFYIVLINFITFICGYIAFSKLSKNNLSGIVLSVLYMLMPYRLICVYFRSAIGEITAMAFIPLVVYGLYAIMYGDKKDSKFLVIGATGVLQAHILSTEITAIFAVVFVLLGINTLFTKEKRYLTLINSAITTLLLNLWFLMPMVIMMMQLNLDVFRRTPVTSQYASADIGSLFYFTKLEIAGPHTLGIITILILFGYPIIKRFTDDKLTNKSASDNFYVNLIWFIFMSTALFPWSIVEKIPLIGTVLSSVQFPYRYLTIVQLCAIVVLALIFAETILKKNTKQQISVFLLIISLIAALMTMEVIVKNVRDGISNKSYYENNIDHLASIARGEYIINGSNYAYMIGMPPVIESENETLNIKKYTRWGTEMSFDYTMDTSGENSDVIVLPVTYIPNYIVKVDGERVYPFQTEDVRVAFHVPSEIGSVTVRYTSPKTFRVSELVSLITCFFYFIALVPKGKECLSSMFTRIRLKGK